MQIVKQIKKQQQQDTFHCSYSAGKFYIDADNPFVAKKAIYQAETAIASGYHAEWIGEWKPRFSLRPLWLKSSVDVATTKDIGISLPPCFLKEESHIEKLCERTLELGYNAWLIGSFENSTPQITHQPLNASKIFSIVKRQGLKIFVKPTISFSFLRLSRCPLEHTYETFLRKSLSEFLKSIPDVDGVFWESQTLHPDCYKHSAAADATQTELMQAEAELLENILEKNKQLVFYVPSLNPLTAQHQAKSITHFCDDVGSNTIIAFSAVAGDPWQDHLPMHPLWTALKATKKGSETPLMPIANVGAIRQGEGLWPVFPSHLMDRIINDSSRHHFAGILTLAPNIPAKSSFLDCALWSASQMQWTDKSFEFNAETWFQAYKPELEYRKFADEICQLRMLAVRLSYLRSLNHEKHRDEISNEECKAMAENLLSQLKHFEFIFQKNKKSPSKPSWNDYFTYLSRDARRIIMHFMQSLHLPIINLKQDEDLQDGFWTRAVLDTSRNIKYQFSETSVPANSSSILHQFYQDTTGN